MPLDSEGWQIGFDTDEAEHESEHVVSGNSSVGESSPHQEQWQTAQSKRSRRNRGRQNGEATAQNGHSDNLSEGTPSSYGLASTSSSIVDLKNDKLHRTNGTAQNGSAAELGSSGFFADLGTLEDDEVKRKKGTRRSKKARANGTHSGRDASPTSAAVRADGSPGQHRGKQSASEDDSLYRLPATYSSHLPSHRDERQAELDILRSFIGLSNKLSPALADPDRRRARRRQLQDVVIGVLRRYPALNYYQGYHDIVSVLLMVLTPADPPPLCEADAISAEVWASKEDFELVLTATIRMTLYYLRDFMAPRIDPCLGWLKCLRNLVRATDEDFSRSVIEQASSLPYFALSWVITTMAHELPTDGQETQTVFDFVLLHGPQGILYIIAALLLTQGRQTVKSLQDDDDDVSDPAMLHHALSKLPATLVHDYQEHTGEDAAGAGRPIRNVIQRAQQLLDDNKSIKGLTQGIMGSSSVLHTWRSLSLPQEQNEGTWEIRNAKAASLLADPEAIAQIVLDPHPSPPPSDHEDQTSYDGEKKASRRRRRPVGNTATAVFVSVLFIAGMAVLIGPAGLVTSSGANSSTSFTQKSKLISDITQLGRGLAGLALCAAGVC